MNTRTDPAAAEQAESQHPFPARARERSTGVVDVESQRAIAEVQAAYLVARANPRDEVRARDQIAQDCGNAKLAEVSVYEYNRGGSDVSGASIRLAETIVRRWGNIECGVKELSRYNGYSDCMAYAVDLETGFRDVKTFQVKHWRDTKKGGYPVKDERDIYELVANMGARRKRACILAIIPQDVVDDAIRQCEVTLKAKVEVNDEFIASLLKAFEVYSVTKEMIEKRIGRRIEAMTPGLAVQLRRIHNSLKDHMSTPNEWFEMGAPTEGEDRTPAGRKKPAAKPGAPGAPAAGEQKTAAAAPGENGRSTAAVADPHKVADASDLAFIRNKLKAAEVTEQEFCKAFQIDLPEDLKAFLVPAALKWITDPSTAPTLEVSGREPAMPA
jgi:hypothetical protein